MSNTEAAGRRLLPAKQVTARYGIVGRTLDRWLDDAELGFPKPTVINKRRYFSETELETWERSRIAGQAHAA